MTLEPLVTAKSKDTGKGEPLAWAYSYGKARVFQTVLGHSAESIRGDGPAALIRRGWTDEAIGKIAGGNFIRVFQAVEDEGRRLRAAG